VVEVIKDISIIEIISALSKYNVPGQGGKEMKEFIEYIAKSLVDHADVVKVTEVDGERTSVIELSVAKEDIGKVIGKQGRTAIAMRTLLSAASMKQKKRTILEIID
jgi:predicted RNA-binding protein YlqC (UPF0109 family)